MNEQELEQIQTEIQEFRSRAQKLSDPKDRWRCMVLVDKVERDLKFVGKGRRQPQ